LRIASQLDFIDVKSHFQGMLAKYWQQLARIVNGNISFGDGTTADNINGVFASAAVPGTPNTNFVITHNLGRIPVGYLVLGKTAAGDIYDGTVAATKTTLTLRASVASFTVRLFIICLLLGVFSVGAQNVRRDDVALQVITQNTPAGTQTFVTPIAGAVITVCNATATGTPCSPTVNVCSSSTDVTCNQPNPLSADNNGNYGFWVPPGRYQVSITSNSVIGKLVTYDLPIGQDNSNNVSANAFAGQSMTAATQITTPLLNFTLGGTPNGSLIGTPNNVTGEAVTEVTVGAFDKLAQSANVVAYPISTPLISGALRVCASLVVTTPASTSSTLPKAQVVYTDADNSTTITTDISATSTGNALTTTGQGCVQINAKLNTSVSIQTTGYASTGGTSLVYSLHPRLEND